MGQPRIFELVRQEGLLQYKDSGAMWAVELEISFVLACPKRAKYDGKRGRIRRHLVLRGDSGSGKSSLSERFLDDWVCAKDIFGAEDWSGPGYIQLDGNGLSWEFLRGSVTSKGITKPPLLMSDFYYISELAEWIGHGNEMKVNVGRLLGLTEEGRISIGLVKAKDIISEMEDDEVKELAEMGIHVNRMLGSARYEPRGTLIACIPPITDKDEVGHYKERGLISRLNLATQLANDDKFKALHKTGFGEPDPVRMAEIQAFNQKAWGMGFRKVPHPPQEMVDRVRSVLDQGYEKIEKQMALSPRQVRSLRDITDSARVITAYAIARLVEAHDPKADPIIEEVTYDDEDVECAIVYMENRLRERFHEWADLTTFDPIRKQSRELLVDFLTGTKWDGGEFSAIEFVSWTQRKERKVAMNEQKALNFLARMVSYGFLTADGCTFGSYDPTYAIYDELLYASKPSSHEALAEEEEMTV